MKEEWHGRLAREFTCKMHVPQTIDLQSLLRTRAGAMMAATKTAQPRWRKGGFPRWKVNKSYFLLLR